MAIRVITPRTIQVIGLAAAATAITMSDSMNAYIAATRIVPTTIASATTAALFRSTNVITARITGISFRPTVMVAVVTASFRRPI